MFACESNLYVDAKVFVYDDKVIMLCLQGIECADSKCVNYKVSSRDICQSQVE